MTRNLFYDTIVNNTTRNPAVFAKASIDDPNFLGLILALLGSCCLSILGALVGIGAYLAARVLHRLRVHFDFKLVGRRRLNVDTPELDSRLEPLLNEAYGEALAFPSELFHQRISAAAKADPDIIALRCGSAEWSIAELHIASVDTGRVLRDVGVQNGSLVALYLQEGPTIVVAILGTWCAGGAWFPIDREAPLVRIEHLLEEGDPIAIVADDVIPFLNSKATARATLLSPDPSGRCLVPWTRSPILRTCESIQTNEEVLTSVSVAQVVYTSGSTGMPKGVIYSHRRLAHACHFFAQECSVTVGTRVLQKTPYVWGVFRHEVWPALCHGGVVVFAESAHRKDPRYLAETLRRESIEVLVATPSVLELILNSAGSPLLNLRVAVCMGESLRKDMAARLYTLSCKSFKLYNFYGATETENTVFCVPRPGSGEWQALTGEIIPAGKPQPCTSVLILDPDTLCTVPRGAVGEIFFGGVLSDGYARRPDLTSERFIVVPGFGRLYRTGDLGRWRPGIGLEVSGRRDRQVKIRGIRVELEEVEALLKEALAVIVGRCDIVTEASSAAATAPGSDNLRIVAFVSPEWINIDSLRAECRRRMPPYMVPSVIRTLSALPRLPNAKVDLKVIGQMAEDAEETVETMDSLGMLRLLSRAQVEEDVWIQNQQAFWMLVVMLGHFQLNGGAPIVNGVDTGNWAWRVEMSLGHGKDMVAFMSMVGFVDSRSPIGYGIRDLVLLILTILMSGPLAFILSPGVGPLSKLFNPPCGVICVSHGWFLYSLLFARVFLNTFYYYRVTPWVQVALVFFLAFVVPDDALDLFPGSWRLWLWNHDAAVRYKGLRWSFSFMIACYLLAFHFSPRLVRWARAHAPNSGWKIAALVGMSWSGYVAMSALNAQFPFGYHTFQVAYDEETPSHMVKWHYMTHPSFLVYATLWTGELALQFVPPLLVAIAMAYCPWHFKTMGTTSLGNYVLHPYYIGAPWTLWLQQPVISLITDEKLGLLPNILIVFIWNVTFCAGFALTAGAGFHWFLVSFFMGLQDRLRRRRRSRSRSPSDSVWRSPSDKRSPPVWRSPPGSMHEAM